VPCSSYAGCDAQHKGALWGKNWPDPSASRRGGRMRAGSGANARLDLASRRGSGGVAQGQPNAKN
jgi:hypothetical protein